MTDLVHRLMEAEACLERAGWMRSANGLTWHPDPHSRQAQENSERLRRLFEAEDKLAAPPAPAPTAAPAVTDEMVAELAGALERFEIVGRTLFDGGHCGGEGSPRDWPANWPLKLRGPDDAEPQFWPDPKFHLTVADFRRADEALARYRAALANTGAPVREGWQPIETAPKDGTRILVSFGTIGVHAVAWLEGAHTDWESWCVHDRKHGPFPLRGWNEAPYPTAPTHWMPLPEPPR